MVTRQKRATNLGCNGRMKPTVIDANIELFVITLQSHKVYSGGLIKVE